MSQVEDKRKWNPPRYQCLDCKDIIYSRYPGEWVSCKCFRDGSPKRTGGFVDQTEYYTRVGGNIRLYEEAKS